MQISQQNKALNRVSASGVNHEQQRATLAQTLHSSFPTSGPTSGRSASRTLQDVQFQGWWPFRKSSAEKKTEQENPETPNPATDATVSKSSENNPPAYVPPKPKSGFLNLGRSRFYRATLLNIEWLARKVGGKYQGYKLKKFVQNANALLDTHPPKTPEHIRAQMLLSQQLFASTLPEIEMNFESPQFQDLIKSDEACIFIINHDHQVEDPALLSSFNTALYEGYIENGKAATCPEPKVILNRDILDTISLPGFREIYEKLGAVPVDASVESESMDTYKQTFMEWATHLIPKRWRVKRPVGENGRPLPVVPPKKDNARNLVPILKAFNENKNHIFLFPEGRHAGRTDDLVLSLLNLDFKRAGLPPIQEIEKDPVAKARGAQVIKSIIPSFDLRNVDQGMTLEEAVCDWALNDRFQKGVVNIIMQSMKRKGQVKVVPLGFALYDQKSEGSKLKAFSRFGLTKDKAETLPEKRLGSVFVGKPLIFKKDAAGDMGAVLGNLKEPEAIPRLRNLFQYTEEGQVRPFRGLDKVPLEKQLFEFVCESLRISKVKSQAQLAKTLQESAAQVELSKLEAAKPEA
jgi:hypothetical protein